MNSNSKVSMMDPKGWVARTVADPEGPGSGPWMPVVGWTLDAVRPDYLRVRPVCLMAGREIENVPAQGQELKYDLQMWESLTA